MHCKMKAKKKYMKGGKLYKAGGLTPKQKQLDADGDGKISGKDFKMKRAERSNARKLKRAERKGAFSDTTRKDQREEKRANRKNNRALKNAMRKSMYKS